MLSATGLFTTGFLSYPTAFQKKDERTPDIIDCVRGQISVWSTELPVSGIAETGDNEGIFIESFVHGCCVDPQVEISRLQKRDAFRSSKDADDGQGTCGSPFHQESAGMCQ